VETTALGAAVGAGIAVGVYSRDFLTQAHAQAETAFDPNMDAEERREKGKGWAKAVRKSFGWVDRYHRSSIDWWYCLDRRVTHIPFLV
jgi:glycerol kinase